MSTISDWTRRWRGLSLLFKLLIINVAIFLIIRIIGVAMLIGGGDINDVIDCLAVPSDTDLLLSRPWTVVTYMFTQYDVFHILFNMLTLFWFGTLFCFSCSQRQLTGLYIIGGLSGAFTYLVAAKIFASVGGYLLGASASVMSIVIATAFIMPDYRIHFFFLGDVRLKWVAIFAVTLFALGLVGNNAGGHVAHIGGVLAGVAYGLCYRKGIDITAWLNKIIDAFVSVGERLRPSKKPRKGSRPKFNHRARAKSAEKSSAKSAPKNADARATSEEDDRRDLDTILDKIKRSGYSALTPDERRRLFDVSSRLKEKK